MNFLFSSFFENISTYYSSCKVLRRNSYGKSDYFNCNFRIRLSTITQFKNDGDKLGRVGPQRKWRRSLNTTKLTWLLSYTFGEVWRYTFLHIRKWYFARLSCAYRCISPNRFRLNCIICTPSYGLFSVSPPSQLRDTHENSKTLLCLPRTIN